MRVRSMSSVNASWLGIAMLTFMSTTGCELITSVDRSTIETGAGGASTSSSSSSSSTSSSTGTGGTGGMGGTGGAGGAGGAGGGPVCAMAVDCPMPANECITVDCVQGACVETNVPADTATMTQTPGDCQKVVCDGNGATTKQNDDADVLSDGKECTDDTCVAGTPTSTPKATNSMCGAGGTLYCDATGACVGCTDASQCGQATDCATPVCNSGACSTTFTAPGTATPNQTAGDCQEEQCNGIGGTKIVTKSSDTLSDNNPCTADTCNGITPTYTNLPSGALCSNGGTGTVCNGGGACVQCLVGTDCTSGVCVAQACAAPTCTDTVKNDVETDVDCGGGVCPSCVNGKACNVGSDCTSTVCSPGKTCVASICGDNKITGPETCDDGGTMSGNGCSATCTIEAGWECVGQPSVCQLSCGDGTLDAGETCDDGGTMSGNGCSATCTIEAGYECTGTPSVCQLSCGDGTLDAGETCDDGGTMSGNGCSATCTIEPGFTCTGVPSVCTAVCGNGSVNGAETCDDSNTTNGDGCSSICAVEPGYACNGAPSVCATVCGDGVKTANEACDDGNTNSGDCCSATCGLESGCEIEPNDTDATANAYASVFISNQVKGFINPDTDTDFFSLSVPAGSIGTLMAESKDGPLGTTCTSLAVDTKVFILDSTLTEIASDDDAGVGYCSLVTAPNLVPGNYYVVVTNSPIDPTLTFDYTLQVNLTLAVCGDGVISGAEICDDNNTLNGDGCSSACAVEPGYQCNGAPSMCTAFVCGDGSVNGLEECDDNNTVSSDGCSATCTVEADYSCLGAPSVCTKYETNCSDMVDNDGDTFVDVADTDCQLPAYFPGCGMGQTLRVYRYKGAPIAIPDNDLTGILSTVYVGPAGNIANGAILLNVTHSYDGDLEVRLIAPTMASYDMSIANGGAGADYINTIFEATCPPVSGGSAPFSACYAPDGNILPLLGTPGQGTWQLSVADGGAMDVGTLNNWALILCTQ